MKKNQSIILLLAIVKFTLPFLLQNPGFELHRDEFLYYEQGQHLSLGFLENPPMIGWLSYLSSLCGGGFFMIKFWPSIFGAGTLLITAGIAKELGGKLFSQVIASLGILFSAYMRIHFLFQPNFLDIFFWTLSVYYLLRCIRTQKPICYYQLSTALALGWWSKYSIVFFAAALVLSLMLNHHFHKWKVKHFQGAIAWGMLLILPNIYWQWTHHWPLLHHMRELHDTQLKYLNKTDFIKEQLLMLFPVCFVWIGGLTWLLRNQQYRILGYMFLLVIFFVMMGSGKGYYTLGAYPMLLAAGGVWLESVTKKKIYWRIAVISLICVLSFPFIPVLLPMQPPLRMQQFNERYQLGKLGLLKWEDRKEHPLQQDFADMLGWKELTQKTKLFYQALPDSIQKNTLIYCRNYGEAGAVRYYGNGEAYSKKVICDNGTFLFWIPKDIRFRHLIFIGRDLPGKDDKVFQHFQQVSIIDSIANPLSREFGTKIIFFHNGSDSAWKLAVKGLAVMKAEFGE